MTATTPKCPVVPGGDLDWSIEWCDAFVASAVAVGGGTAAKGIILAGEIIVSQTGIRAVATVGSSGKAYVKRAIAGAGGMLKGCIVGMAFLAVCCTGIILVMLGVASGSAGGSTVRWCTVALVTVGWC